MLFGGFFTITNKADMNIQVFKYIHAFISLAQTPKSEWLDDLVGKILPFKKLPNCFSQWLYHLHADVQSHQHAVKSQCLHFFANTCMVSLFILHLLDVHGYLNVALICISLMTNYAEHVFMCLTAIHISSLPECLNPLPIFKNWIVCLLSEFWKFFRFCIQSDILCLINTSS